MPRFYDSVKDVESTEVSADGKLVVRMSNVSYWHLNKIGSLPIIPQKVLNEIKDWQNWNPLEKSVDSGPYGLIGSGPFKLETYKAGEYVMMEKNKYYRMLSNPKRSMK